MSTQMRKVGSGATPVGRAIVGVGAVLGGIGYVSAKAAMSFQASMERIHTQAGGPQKDVTNCSAAILQMTSRMQTAQGPQQLAQGLYHLESVGMRGSQAMKALAASANLADVAGANMEDTTTALVGAWRAGIKGGGDFNHIVAVMNA